MTSSSKALRAYRGGTAKAVLPRFRFGRLPRDRISGTVAFPRSTCSRRRHVLLPSEIAGTALRLTMLLIKL